MNYPIRVLFICRHDSIRAPLAAALLRHLGGDDFQVHHAGVEPQPLDDGAARLLEHLNIPWDDTGNHALADYRSENFDYIISMCDKSHEKAPHFAGDQRHIRWDFPDLNNGGVNGSQDRYLHRLYMELVERIRLWVEMEHGQMRRQGLVGPDRFAWPRSTACG